MIYLEIQVFLQTLECGKHYAQILFCHSLKTVNAIFFPYKLAAERREILGKKCVELTLYIFSRALQVIVGLNLRVFLCSKGEQSGLEASILQRTELPEN